MVALITAVVERTKVFFSRRLQFPRTAEENGRSAPCQFWRRLHPLLGFLAEMGYLTRALFLLGLMFVYTHFGSAAPCPDNIEGMVYLKRRYIDVSTIARFQLEMVLYSLLFSLVGSWVLFL